MKRQCWLIGHEKIFDDSGYGACSCGTHEYYNEKEYYRIGILYLPKHFYNETKYNLSCCFHKWFHICSDCKKFWTFFGISVGNHSKCMPF